MTSSRVAYTLQATREKDHKSGILLRVELFSCPILFVSCCFLEWECPNKAINFWGNQLPVTWWTRNCSGRLVSWVL